MNMIRINIFFVLRLIMRVHTKFHIFIMHFETLSVIFNFISNVDKHVRYYLKFKTRKCFRRTATPNLYHLHNNHSTSTAG